MRVGLNLEQLLQPVPGGTGRYAASIARLLPALFPGDVVVPFVAYHRRRVVVSALRRSGVRTAAAEPVVLALPRPLLYDAWHLLGAPAPGTRASLGSCDLVHAPSPAVPPRGRQPLVVSVHDAAFELFPEAYPRRGLWFHRQGVAAAARRADRVLTGSRAAAEEIAAHTPISATQIRVVPYGVDHVATNDAEVATTLGRYQLAGDPYILWVGTLEPRKNLSTLVRAFATLERSWRRHRLVLVGPTGWLRQGLFPGGEPARLGDRLRVLGHVPEADLRSLYAGADVFCLPSLHEGFGLPVLEAMAQGTPVVCSDVPALREVAADAAVLVPPLDAGAWAAALDALLGDGQRRSTLGVRGRARARLFSWERCVTETRAVYTELLGR